ADRVAVNPPGVDLDLWTPVVDDPPRATDDRLRVVFVGGDFDRKGGNDLLAWFRSNTDPRYELHLVTPEDVDPEPGVTVHRLSEADPEMQEFVRRAHVFVLPSRAECFGLATLEALASGVPVVQSTVGGAADIVTPGVTGALVRAGSTDEIGRALAEVFEDPDRYDQMRLAARADAVERFSIARNVDATVALIHEAIAAHAAEER
ncbi:MAG: glycosyltransferase family 4 protein, partial [Actinomycetota bacterium]